MSSFFRKQKKPSNQKNTFENYYDHVNCLIEDLTETINEIDGEFYKGNINVAFSKVNREFLKRLNLFEPLYDRYDYLDEIGGAIVVPILGISIALASLSFALWEGIQLLAIKTRIKQDDGEKHNDKAIQCLLFSGANFLISVYYSIKSVISLITRPLMTLITGWKKEDEPRFIREDSFEAWVGASFQS
ncbi:hypothetical protein [Legionella impletisoli]|uniref:Uncharacterized protein n=1 Tax=Legionella impletisoli TaxID=343510 RepID=A0A917NDE3_9GAMM|nr:hypothetical protein [Legionella impletisoli]GGI91253.1 hypothetical protein GCM10007966_19910 [Legionella impletisoli]